MRSVLNKINYGHTRYENIKRITIANVVVKQNYGENVLTMNNDL